MEGKRKKNQIDPNKRGRTEEESVDLVDARGVVVNNSKKKVRGQSASSSSGSEYDNEMGKDFVFTWNNPTLTDDQFESVVRLEWKVNYFVAHWQKGNGTGTNHYQGYVEFTNRRRIQPTLKRLLGAAHWERRKGSADQARSYIVDDPKKTNDPEHRLIEIGEFKSGPRQGRRTDIERLHAAAAAGGLKAAAREEPLAFIQYGRGLREWLNVQASDDQEIHDMPEVSINYGPPGCGKTSSAIKSYLDRKENYWLDNSGDSWFDGYMGEQNVCFDDFDGARSKMTLKMWLRLNDRYPMRVPVKGSYIQWKATDICYTSNIHPRDWWDYSGREAQFGAIKRRVSMVRHWNGDGRGNAAPGEAPKIITPDGNPELWERWWNKHGRIVGLGIPENSGILRAHSTNGNVIEREPVSDDIVGPMDMYVEHVLDDDELIFQC